MITRGIIAVCGLLGMLAIVETAQYYADADPLAFRITLVMGLVLLGGVVELFLVSRRTRRLHTELEAFPRDATYDHVEGASPLLRALLGARLDRTALPVPGPVFTPFILSLLVMLGLLGTFLGLFETLRGAGYALDASADVEALRSGLKAPIGGLMRSFGTSAAGVASSAMLGMAAVFVRRDANRFGVQLHAMASGPLAHYAPAARQLVALETLAEQGKAWPTAAAALQQAVERLDRLGETWTQAHAEATRETREQLKDATREVAETVTRGVDRAAQSASEAVTPLLQEAARKTGEASAEHLSALREQIDRDLQARTRHEATLREQVGEQLRALGEREAQRADSLAGRFEALGEHVREAFEDSSQRVREAFDGAAERDAQRAQVLQQAAETTRAAGEAHLSALREQFAAELQARNAHEAALREQAAEQLQALAEQERKRATTLADGFQQLASERAGQDAQLLQALQTELRALHAQEAERAESLAARFEALSEDVRSAFANAAERDEQRAAALGEVGARMQRDLAEAASVVRERLQHSADAEAGLQQRAEQLFERLDAASHTIARAASTQVDALSQFVEATDGRLRDAEKASQERLAEVLAEWRALGQTQAERMAEFEQTLLSQHQSTAQDLGERLGEHAQALDKHLADSAQLLRQAATLVHSGGAELSGVAESFAAAVASQREGARQWLESLGDIERYAMEAGEAAASDALGQHLARTHEVFDRQLQFQQELIEQLQGMRRRESMVAPRADASA
jgi:hypothetical protein